MLLHGGFWKQAFDRSLMTPIAEALAEAGLIVWNVEYRRWRPDDEGVWQETISDVLRAWGHLEASTALMRPGPPSSVILREAILPSSWRPSQNVARRCALPSCSE